MTSSLASQISLFFICLAITTDDIARHLESKALETAMSNQVMRQRVYTSESNTGSIASLAQTYMLTQSHSLTAHIRNNMSRLKTKEAL